MLTNGKKPQRLRSQLWFDNPDNPGMTALYLERYLNYGLTRAELTAGKPIDDPRLPKGIEPPGYARNYKR